MLLKSLIEGEKFAGANCLIWKDGEHWFQSSEGYRNLDRQELMTVDTLFRISSMSKPITSVIAMMLYEENKLNLSNPITKWFPQFDNLKVIGTETGNFEKARRPIMVDDLLTHRSGFTYSEFQTGKLRDDYRLLGGDIDSDLTNEQWINRLADLPLISQPGEVFNYGRSTDLLGILISTIEGKPLGQVMQERLFGPLGMTDTFFDVPENKKDRCAANFGYDELGALVSLETVPCAMALKERPANLEFQSGGQGLWSTISDYLKFARIFVENGCSEGIRILKQETIDLMCSNHLADDQRAKSTLMGSPIFRNGYGFGLGLAVVMDKDNYVSVPCAGSPGSVGWPGAYGGWWSADPSKKAVSIFLSHSMTEPGQLAQGIGFALYEAIDMFADYCKKVI